MLEQETVLDYARRDHNPDAQENRQALREPKQKWLPIESERDIRNIARNPVIKIVKYPPDDRYAR
jgi:hypothetical protein